MKGVFLIASLISLAFKLSAQENATVVLDVIEDRAGASGKVAAYLDGRFIQDEVLQNGRAEFSFDQSVSIDEHEFEPMIGYTNPVILGNLNLFIDRSLMADGELLLYDLQGRKIAELDIDEGNELLIDDAPNLIFIGFRDQSLILRMHKVINFSERITLYVTAAKPGLKSKKSGETGKILSFRYTDQNDVLRAEKEIGIVFGGTVEELWDVTLLNTRIYQKVKGIDGNSDLIRNRTVNDNYLGGNDVNTWMGGGGAFDKHFIVNFDPVELKNAGDEIKVVLVNKLGNGNNGLNQSNSTGNSIRFGLYNNKGLILAPGIGDAHEAFRDFTGYYGAFGVKSENSPRLFKRRIDQNYLVLGNSGVELGGGIQGGNLASSETRRLELLITRMVEGTRIQFRQNGSGSFDFTVNDLEQAEYTFNAIVFALDDTPELIDWLWISDLFVEYKTSTHPQIFRMEVSNGTGGGSYPKGSVIAIKANDAQEGKVFDAWMSTSNQVKDIHDPETEVVLDQDDLLISATYRDARNFKLSVTGGEGSGTFPEQSVQKIAAGTPPAGQVFDRWMGDVENLGNVEASNTDVKILSKDISLHASYKNGDGKIALPIEIMGLPPHIEKIELDLGDMGSDARALYVQVHNISYDNKGSLRVNGGDWIDLNNQNPAIGMHHQERSYGGFGGGFSTVRFTVNTSYLDFRDSINTIEFRYNFRNAPTAGFRVLNTNILNDAGENLVPDSTFYEDDPMLWVAPLNTAEDIAAGEQIFKGADLGMGANCNDCHTRNGMDLKYFNVSNKTIIEQCIKSGFSREEGERVASFIRSIDIPVVPHARVYNPPYQPGPGIDDKHLYEWAAGAGLEWVLERDEEMLPYLFGDGSRAAIDSVTDIKKDLNLREIPVAVMFPDWLRWIPRTHPMDIWGEEIWENSEKAPGGNIYYNAAKAYENLRDLLEQQGADGLLSQNRLVSSFDQFARDVMFWMGHTNNTGHPWTATIAPMLDKRKPIYSAEWAKTNLAAWQSMKLFELVMEFELQDKARQEIPTAEERAWPINEFAMFVIPAHFTGDDRGTSQFAWESPVVGAYWSSVWYEVQITVNSGMREPHGVAPSDWSYNLMHINRLGERSDIFEPLRYSRNLIKCYQQRDQPVSRGINFDTWIMREVSPWRVYSNYNGDQRTMQKMNEYRSGMRADFSSSILSQFLRKVNEFELNQWPRTNVIGFGSDYWYTLEYADYDPTDKKNPGTGSDKLFAPDGSFDAVEAHAFYNLLDGRNGPNRLQQIGVDEPVIRGLAEWADEIWTNPVTDWFTWDK
jgi:hypothetical protein